MLSQTVVPDVATAVAYLGKTVVVELQWDDEPQPHSYCVHVVGVVLPMEGVFDEAYFMIKGISDDSAYPGEMFFSDIRSIRPIPKG